MNPKCHLGVETEAGSGFPRPGKRYPHCGAGPWGNKHSSPPSSTAPSPSLSVRWKVKLGLWLKFLHLSLGDELLRDQVGVFPMPLAFRATTLIWKCSWPVPS